MNLRLLEYFLITAESESINKAAETIPISQPTLSRQLRELENEVGVELFTRDNKGITLTEEGVLLKRRAREILDLMSKTEQELKEQTDIIEGKIVVGCGETKAVEKIAPLMKQFHEMYNKVTFELFTGSADDVTEGMDRGLIDITLLVGPDNLEKYNYIALNDRQYWKATMSANDPLAEKEYITKGDLIGRGLVFPKRVSMNNKIRKWFGDDYDKVDVVFTGNLLINSLILVQDGKNIAITIEKPDIISGGGDVISRPLKPQIYEESYLAWERKKPYPKVVDRFISFLKENLPDGKVCEKEE